MTIEIVAVYSQAWPKTSKGNSVCRSLIVSWTIVADMPRNSGGILLDETDYKRPLANSHDSTVVHCDPPDPLSRPQQVKMFAVKFLVSWPRSKFKKLLLAGTSLTYTYNKTLSVLICSKLLLVWRTGFNCSLFDNSVQNSQQNIIFINFLISLFSSLLLQF